jgi:predicted nucleic acid-binding protein
VALRLPDRRSEARALRIYVDPSALLKLVLAEADSETMLEIWKVADEAVCLSTGYVEGRAAIARRVARQAPRVRQELDERWEQVQTETVDDELIAGAVRVADVYRLRSLDSLHLAAAVRAGGDLTFVTWDAELRAAASGAGFTTLPR